MSQSIPFPAPADRAASVLPLHGSRAYAPSSVLVRARLGEELNPAGVRAAVAFFAESCDLTRLGRGSNTRWWVEPTEVDVGVVADRALLVYAEAEAALAALEAARLLAPVEKGYRIDADALCECPSLLRFDIDSARARLRAEGHLAGPATALLREVVRLAREDGALSTTIPRLLDVVLYGRTRLTQALSVLERVRLVARSDLPNRMVRLQLLTGEVPAPPPVPARPSEGVGLQTRANSGRIRLPTNAPLQVGGQTVDVLPGVTPELELGSDGRYYLWIGPVRIGPYGA